MDEFTIAEHRFGESKYLEDLQIGQRFYIPSRTQTTALFSAFALASGDNHPLHYDRPYCQAHGHRDLLAHGLQVLIQTAPGAGIFPHYLGDSLVAFLEQSSKFLAPVYAEDTLYPWLEVAQLLPGRTTGVAVLKVTVHNQDEILVLDGEQRFLVRRRPELVNP